MKANGILLLAVLATGCASHPRTVAAPAPGSADGGAAGIFLQRSTDKSPEAVVEAIRAYAEARKWPYLGADKVKQGQVTLVKVCIPEVGQQLWQVGLHVSAMLPCGNLGVYRNEDGKTGISLLHPRYMQLLHPGPTVAKAAATAEPLLIGMLDAVAGE